MDLELLLDSWRLGGGSLVFLTGAGISAESGIPTFRGPDGFWTVGSERYAPQDLATRAMFEREPETVWCWYLARFAAASGAQPNAAHRAVAELQAAYRERIAVVTQNVDALHHRAGSPHERTFAIHGDARVMRCARGCGDLVALPPVAIGDERHRLPAGARSALTCASCTGWMRPHVLWFDEYYDELHYRSESALAAAEEAELLVVVGTTGATTLPMVIATRCARRGVPIIDVNVEATPFSALAERLGAVMREPASVAVPRIARRLAPVS
jgi:NAD-dependent deacetylase